MGWHFEAISPCRRLKVSGDILGRHGKYLALLGDAGSPGGRWVGHGRTARSAARNVIKIAEADLRRVDAVLRNLPEV